MRTSVTKIRLVGLALLAVVVIAIYLAITAISGVPAYPYKTATATFATASNVVAHDDVRINGARIGQVTATKYDPKTNLTQVTMQLQPGHTLYRNASAGVGDVSALGSEYITLNPGTPSSGSLPGSHIGLGNTTTPVEIDSILNILGPKQADAAAASVQTLGQGFGGRGEDINTILRTAPQLLPNLSTTAATLTRPASALVPLIAQADLLSSRFQGRTQQLAQLLGNMNTTFKALDTEDGSALRSTIDTAAPTLPVLTPALNQLGSAAGTAATAFTDLRPGLAALGAGTPDLRRVLVQGVSPLRKVPGVSKEAIPGVTRLSTTLATAQVTEPVVPFVAQLESQANPLLSYLEPYTVDMTNLWNTLANGLQDGDVNGNWLPFTVTEDARTVTGGASPGIIARCAYPAPNTSANDRLGSGSSC